MSASVLVNSAANSISDTIQPFYTSPSGGAGTRISAFTATNNTDSNKIYEAFIYGPSQTGLGAVMPRKIVITNKFDTGGALINQLIPPGGSLNMRTNIAGSIDFRVTGDEL